MLIVGGAGRVGEEVGEGAAGHLAGALDATLGRGRARHAAQGYGGRAQAAVLGLGRRGGLDPAFGRGHDDALAVSE